MAHDRAGNGAKAGALEIDGAPPVEFRLHLVPPCRALGPALDERIGGEAEVDQHRLLQPLIDRPLPVTFFRHAKLATVEHGQSGLDRIADRPLRGRADLAAVLKGGVDGVAKCVGIGAHGWSPG
jgi:hypothetical protein